MNRLEEIEKRLNTIRQEIEVDGADLDALETEVTTLTEERKGLMDSVEKRKTLVNTVANLQGAEIIKDFKEERRMPEVNGVNSIEYKNAFLKNLLGEQLTEVEERAFVHTTVNTEQVIPEELQNKIYSTMEEAHPILADVQVLRTGTVITIVKHTAIVAGDAKIVAEGVANDDEQNTFVNVSLNGKDFSKHVYFSYRLGKMSIPAFEQYLVKEISDRIGAAMAADIYAQIKADLAATNKFAAATPGTLLIF